MTESKSGRDADLNAVFIAVLSRAKGVIHRQRQAGQFEAEAVSNGKNNSGATWIDDGEKYALVGLSVKVDG
jgi:hypothetical protein